MKLKALLLALVVAGLTASYALADDGGHGKGKGKSGHALVASTSADTTTTVGDDEDGDDDGAHHGKGKAKQATCRPSFSVNLAGRVAAAPSGDSFALLVSKGNAHGRKLRGKQLTVDASHAKVVKKGKRKAADLAAGDRVLVKARACVDLAEGTVSVIARQVVVLGAKHASDDDDSSTSTSTSTSDSTTSTTESTTSTTG